MPRKATSKVCDQTCLPSPKNRASGTILARGVPEPSHPDDRVGSSLPETVNYVTGRRQPSAMVAKQPELLIEGGGGSLMMDLRGMGVELHRDAFAFRMPDDSLSADYIRGGDIAIIEPCTQALQEGDIVMVALGGVGTLRRVTYRGEIAYFQEREGEESPLLPAWEHAFAGVVTAIFRLYYHGRLLTRSRPPAPKQSVTRASRLPKRPQPKFPPSSSDNCFRDGALDADELG